MRGAGRATSITRRLGDRRLDRLGGSVSPLGEARHELHGGFTLGLRIGPDVFLQCFLLLQHLLLWHYAANHGNAPLLECRAKCFWGMVEVCEFDFRDDLAAKLHNERYLFPQMAEQPFPRLSNCALMAADQTAFEISIFSR